MEGQAYTVCSEMGFGETGRHRHVTLFIRHSGNRCSVCDYNQMTKG